MIPAIVHVASGREWRGGQRQVWLLARELGSRGINQVVITGKTTELARRLRSSGIPVRQARWQAGLDPRVVPPILRELRSPVLLHAHDSHALTLGGACAVLMGTRYVVTRRVAFPVRRPYFWRRASRVIAISTAVRDALVAAGVAADRVVIVPSAVDPAAAEASGGTGLRQRLGIPQNGHLAVQLASLTPEKGQETLLEAAAKLVRDLPGLQWVVVGEGPLRDQLDQQIERLALQGRVHLLGPIDDPHAVLAEADVLVLSSTSEGLGSAALAALARGVPVVATRVGGVPDMLGTEAGLLVEPKDPVALAEAVKRVLTDPIVRSRLIDAGGRELPRFSVPAMADRLLSVYRSCAHSLGCS